MAKRYPGGFITATFKPLDPHGDYYNLYTWGSNSFGNIGTNSTVSTSSPVIIGTSLTTWISHSLTGRSAGGIKSTNNVNGSLYTWGNNADSGQLGDSTIINKSSPTQVGSLTNWSKIGVGTNFMLAIKSDGTMWSWGSHVYGEMGDNTAGTAAGRSSPVQIGADTNWSKLAVGGAVSLVIRSTGTLWSFGYNSHGALGLNDRNSRSSPSIIGAGTDWAFAAVGNSNSAAIKTNGTLWTWGRDLNGEAGQGSTLRRSSPVQVGALTNWKYVSLSRSSTNAIAVKTDGTLWTWGGNSTGQLGNNTVVNSSTPGQVGILTDWSLVSTDGGTCIAIKTNGTLWAWGLATAGETGNNDLTNRSSPIQIGSLTNWTSLATGQNICQAILGNPF